MTNVTFKVGDVVRLKSDGPWMTIERIDEKNYPMPMACCIWRGSRDDVSRCLIACDCLILRKSNGYE